MTFIERVNKGLEKQDLEFVEAKEFNEKYKGYLKDKKDGYKIKFEINKALRLDMLNSWSKWARGHLDLHKQLYSTTNVKEGK